MKKEALRPHRLIIAYILIALIRIWISSLLGVWFPSEQGGDDALMVLYSAFPNYFRNMSHDWVMLKELGMPVFLQIVNFSGISYPIALSILWIIDGLLLSRIAKTVSGSDAAGIFVYGLTLFVPASFELHCGTRLYRAGLLNPMYVMTFALLSMLLIFLWGERKTSGIRMLLYAVIAGLVLSFTCYIKEDGIWIIAIACAFALCGSVLLAVRLRDAFDSKVLVRGCACVLMPFVILLLVTAAYKGVNGHFFGVYETNARTSGESGRFVSNIYKIASNERTNVVWAPKDAIEKAFEASATLSSHPELKEEIYTSDWLNGDIDTMPITGDFLTWIVKDAVFDCGLVNTVRDKEIFFKQVNSELDEAFRNGSLNKESKRVSILPSLGPKTGNEIAEAARKAFFLMGYHIFLYEYEPGGRIVTGEAGSVCMPATIITNYNVMPLNDEDSIVAREIEIKIADIPVRLIFVIGKILIPVLLIVSLVGIVFSFADFFKSRLAKEKFFHFMLGLTALGLLAAAYVYSFMVALFCTEFAEKMYSVGVVSLLLVVIAIGTSLFLSFFRDRK